MKQIYPNTYSYLDKLVRKDSQDSIEIRTLKKSKAYSLVKRLIHDIAEYKGNQVESSPCDFIRELIIPDYRLVYLLNKKLYNPSPKNKYFYEQELFENMFRNAEFIFIKLLDEAKDQYTNEHEGALVNEHLICDNLERARDLKECARFYHRK